MVLGDLPGWQTCPSHRLPRLPPPALAWFPLVWPGFGLPPGGFPANARAARARACAGGDLWQPTAVPVVFPEPTPSPNPKPQAHSTGDDGFKLTAC